MSKTKTPTKVKRQKKIRKLLMACGHQRNDITDAIAIYQPLYPKYEEFIEFLKSEVESFQLKADAYRALRIFGNEMMKMDRHMACIQEKMASLGLTNEESKEAFMIKKSLEEV